MRQRRKTLAIAGAALAAVLLFALVLIGGRGGLDAVLGPVLAKGPRARASVTIVRRLVPERAWDAVHSGTHAPKPHKLWPVRNAPVDGGPRYGLRMPPPCAVRFTVRPEDGPVRLRAAAGVDHRIPAAAAGGRVRFEVDVNGAPVFGAEVDLRPDAADARAWRNVGGADGLALEPGDVVTLRTDVQGLDPAAVPRIPAGFAPLELERRGVKQRLQASPDAPSLLLIVMDTLRADRLSCYGYRRPTSPNLDALAARGVLYESAYATSSWTWPSTASLLTGLWPETHGVTSIHSCYLDGGLETVAEVLSSRGYWTAAFSCNPLIARGKNFDQGFDEFEDGNIPGMVQRGFCSTDRVEADILGWLDRNAGTRFFLYLHLVDTHWPYEILPEARALLGGDEPAGFPRRGFLHYQKLLLGAGGAGGPPARDADVVGELVPPEHQDWLWRSYDAAVRSADAHVGAILARLEQLRIDGSTVVLFTSDHGEELLDHGLLGHGFALYEEHVRVPLVLAGPGIPAGLRAAAPVSNRHVAPTLARLGGGEMGAVDAPLDLAATAIADDSIFVSTENGVWYGRQPLASYGVRDAGHVLIHAPLALPAGAPDGAQPGDGQALLFDLESDPAQRVDVCAARPAIARSLRALLSEHVESAQGSRSGRAVPADATTLRMLEEVGYVESAREEAEEE